MKLKKISIKDFKRFSDLELCDLPKSAKVIMIAGPNGCGKSSFFDALYTWHTIKQRGQVNWDPTYHRKTKTNKELRWTGNDIQVEFHGEPIQNLTEPKKSFYFRSAYRNEPEFNLSQLRASGDLLDQKRFSRMIDNDAAVSQNYQRLASDAFVDAFDNAPGELTLHQFREQTIGTIRDAFSQVFPDLKLNNLGNPLANGTFRFTKGVSSGFLFKNLSGGEKAVFDLILDLVVARKKYDDTVFCIDEPESHINPRLQGTLLTVLTNLVPKNCQLILATHSIGMMRQAREVELSHPGKVVFLDFGDRDFDKPQIITPIVPNRAFWERVYAVAIDDLATLVAPQVIVICEGSPKLPKVTKNQSHDAKCFEQIFEAEFPETRFISGGNASDVASDRFVLSEAFNSLVQSKVIRLIDRDDLSHNEIADKKNEGVRVLTRRNLESYLFDDEVLKALSIAAEKQEKLAELIELKNLLIKKNSGPSDNMKLIKGELYNGCKELLKLKQCGNNADSFMRDTLAPLIRPGMKIYSELSNDIFGKHSIRATHPQQNENST